MRNLIHLVVTTVLAGFMACDHKVAISPNDAYTAEIAACASSSSTLQESCFCRQGVEARYGVCASFPGPAGSRCNVDCGKVK